MYRADLVRSSEAFGFINPVLAYERTHEATHSSQSKEVNRYWSAYLNDLILMVLPILTRKSLIDSCTLDKHLKCYHASSESVTSGQGILGLPQKWARGTRLPLSLLAMLKAGVVAVLQKVLNPEAIRKLWKRLLLAA